MQSLLISLSLLNLVPTYESFLTASEPTSPPEKIPIGNSSIQFNHKKESISSSLFLSRQDDITAKKNSAKPILNNHTNNKTHLIFPGGGIFFYWQAGVITYLREQNYKLLQNNNNDDDIQNKVHFTGASAGALCATLTCTDVNFEQATELALQKAEDVGVWDRPLGLYGIWGDMIEDWLDELLPENS